MHKTTVFYIKQKCIPVANMSLCVCSTSTNTNKKVVEGCINCSKMV